MSVLKNKNEKRNNMARDEKELKSRGFLKQIQDERYSLRIKVVGGQVTAKQLNSVYKLAKKYGNGAVHLTARQSIEVPFIKEDEIDAVLAFLAQEKLEPASTGPKVRTITACQGNGVCQSGLIDTALLARELDERFGGRPVPHKFKLGITGCRNNCLKAEENDIGIKGAMVPAWTGENCTYCGLCQKICPASAILVDWDERKLTFHPERCLSCGRCVKRCPQKSWTGESGFVLYFGGLYGNRIVIGRQLLPVIHSKEKLFQIIETALQLFDQYGNKGERFSTMLDRIGWDVLKEKLQDL